VWEIAGRATISQGFNLTEAGEILKELTRGARMMDYR